MRGKLVEVLSVLERPPECPKSFGSPDATPASGFPLGSSGYRPVMGDYFASLGRCVIDARQGGDVIIERRFQ